VTWVGVLALILTAAILLIMAAASYRRSNGAVLGYTKEAVLRPRPREGARRGTGGRRFHARSTHGVR
jgi:hypothetical protein